MRNQKGQLTLLVVEDDAALRRLFTSMLDNGGFTTLAAGTAAEGLSIVRQHHGAIDLAVVDMVMPGESGLDLATDLGREFPELKILYISGYVDSIAADVISRRTPDRVLLKPFNQDTLLARVHLLLETAPIIDPGQAGQTAAPHVRPRISD